MDGTKPFLCFQLLNVLPLDDILNGNGANAQNDVARVPGHELMSFVVFAMKPHKLMDFDS